ncbi:MAG: hypothetical protein GC151_16590 [Betaproteobacteria bacterium]|nr:hypothetical protein [Betaproteobacteria bacterium]
MTPPVVIDVEASGFGRGSYPIEVGVAMPECRTHCFLIRPLPEWTHWDPSAEAVHGISRATLVKHGRPVDEVADELNDLLAGRVAYSDAWGHDTSWVALLFEDASRTQAFRIEPLRGLLTDSELNGWHAARASVQRALGVSRHRASLDALVLQRTFVSCCMRPASPVGSTGSARGC